MFSGHVMQGGAATDAEFLLLLLLLFPQLLLQTVNYTYYQHWTLKMNADR